MQPSNVYKPFTYFIPMSSKYVDSSKMIMLPSGQIAYRSYTFSKGRSLPPSSSVSSSSSSASRRHSKFSSNASVAEKPLPKAAKSDLYKTRLCKNFLEKGACPYGKLCQYAHGMSELRQSPLGWFDVIHYILVCFGVMSELHLSINIMPAKHVVTLVVLMTDTIADMKSKLSVSHNIQNDRIEINQLSGRINEDC